MGVLKNERGVSLVELMIVVFTGGLLLVMAMGTLLNVSGTSTNYTQSLDTEIEELNAANALQMIFGQAIEMKYNGPGSMNSYARLDGRGALRGDFDSDTTFNAYPPVSTLAVFTRDRQNSLLTGVSSIQSQLAPTAVYFQQPTSNTWGVLYVSLGNGPLQPTRSDLFFEGLVRVRIMNVRTFTPDASLLNPNVGDPVTSFDIELTFRRFLGDVKSDQRLFCPRSNMATCANIGAYKDVPRVFKINLRNNILAASPNSDPASPKGGRMYDLIHFFTLGRAAELR